MQSGRGAWSNGKSAYRVSVCDAVWTHRKCLPCRNFGLRSVKVMFRVFRLSATQRQGTPLPVGSSALAYAESIEGRLIEVPRGAQALGVLEPTQCLLGL